MPKKLAGKVAIVTGAGRGIGKAIAEKLAENGATAVIADIDGRLAGDTAREFKAARLDALPHACDVSREESVRGLIEDVAARYGRIDILVNNAGIITTTDIESITLDEWNRTIAVNLTGTFLCSKYAFEHMKAVNGGRIVNIASVAGQSGGILVGPDYSASKGGIIALTKALARFGAPYNILANAVSPGTIPTQGITGFDPARTEDIRAGIPLKRFATPENVADIVLFLASDESGYITGATVDINGGMLMR